MPLFPIIRVIQYFLGVDSITCNGQGTCSSGNSGICECDSGFTGDRCNITTCPGSGGVVCSGNGNCNQGPPLACDCQAGFHGDDCASKLEIYVDFSFLFLETNENNNKRHL